MTADLTEYPWKETAVAVRPGPDGFPEVFAEGSLLQVAYKLKELPSMQLADMRVTLPDRGVRPFGFQRTELNDLLTCTPWIPPSERLKA